MPEPKFVKTVTRITYFDDGYYDITMTDGDTKNIISTTTILEIAPKPWLSSFYKKNTPEEIERRFSEGQIRGSRLHWAFNVMSHKGVVLYEPAEHKNPPRELIDQNRLIIAQCRQQERPYFFIRDQEEMLQVLRVREFYRVVKANVLFSELIVWSIQHDTAGTLDLILDIPDGSYNINGSKNVVLDGGLYLADYKTGAIDLNINFTQLASYLKCLEECQPDIFARIKGGLILHPNASTRSGQIPGFAAHFKSRDEILNQHWPYFQNLQAIWRFNNPNHEAKAFDFDTMAVLDDDFTKDTQYGQSPNATLTKQLEDSVRATSEAVEAVSPVQQEKLALGEDEAPRNAPKQPITGGAFLHKRGKRGG